MKNILLLSTMYPGPLRPATPVCHYFALEWVKMGYNVLVVDYRSMFPPIYTWVAKLFPKLARLYVGNHVEMDRNMNVVQHVEDGIQCYSVPVFKYIPHGKYSRREINNQVVLLLNILNENDFIPNAIIGHFYNPCMELAYRLKKHFPEARTCCSLHEFSDIILKNYKKNYAEILSGIDVLGFRSVPLKTSFENTFGKEHLYLMCPSGTAPIYLEKALPSSKKFANEPLTKFIYVGQFIKRKFPRAVAEAIYDVYGNGDFTLDYVGKFEHCFPEVESYAKSKKIENRVNFLGKLPRESIIDYYDKAQCFIMISKYEIFGLVYLEAMSRGCITIASRNEGMEGIIQDGVNGFLCEAGNVEELKSIIRRINGLTADEKNKISENAINTARKLSDKNVSRSYINNVFAPHSDDLI